MKIAVCGCSFSTAFPPAKGRHWSEILSSKLDCHLMNFAKGGVSNRHIRLQIETAIKFQPDWIIVNAATHPRIEIPTKKNREGLSRYNLFHFNDPINEGYMISLPLVQFFEKKYRRNARYNKIFEEKEEYARDYFENFYDDIWKRQVDQWIINSGLWQIHENNINLSYDPWLLDKGMIKEEPHVPDTMPQWFKERYYKKYQDSFSFLLNDHRLDLTEDPGFHLDDSAQGMISDYYVRMIDSYSA